ncbi:ribonucleotide-diphosphate reductase subunit beta [Escherichia coli]|nr:ribonucleotide-diphosphate reductase subunit beta [Escherichia coli]
MSNLKYQTLLDSIQGRSPNVALLPLISIPELETWVETWAFSETIHSRSYTHIIRNIVNDPSVVFDDIVTNEQIQKRAEGISSYYDELIEMTSYWHLLGEGTHTVNGKTVTVSLRELKKKLYLCLMSVNALEAIRFYVSFACSFAFAERELMEGNAKIIRLIARDEALHLTGTQHMLNLLRSGADDPEMAEIAEECKQECYDLFVQAAQQEKDWADYLFRDGSMIGLNKDILCQYVEYITNIRMQAVGLDLPFQTRSNPIPWINTWLVSDNVQVAPQEVEVSSYLVGQIDSEVDTDDLARVTLRITGTQLLCQDEHPSLLAALESHNVAVEYQCREGYCGSCRTRLVAGQVDWIAEPLAFIQPGEILPCCCRAKGDIEIEL